MSDELDQKESETEEPDVEAHGPGGHKKAANVEAGDETDRDDDFEGHMKKG